MNSGNDIQIKNKRASFEYSFIDKYVAGLQLKGTEIKSIRLGKANISDAFCTVIKNELWVRNMNIDPYEKGNIYNHEPKRDRKLLLHKNELKKIASSLNDQGISIIPTKLYISEKGFAKLEIAVAKGKKLYDKREDIKKRDLERIEKRKF